MEPLLETLTNLQPVIIIGLLLILWVMESFIPYLSPAPNRRRHAGRNLALLVTTLVVNTATGLLLNEVMAFQAAHRVGLLAWIGMPPLASLLLGMLLIDFWDYGYHVLTHKVAFFWRFHRVHHSDTALDSTSSLRFHPFEIISQALNWALMFVVLGISAASFVMYFTFFVGLTVLQHANVKLPDWLERYGSYVFATPGWHKMHHAADRRLTDSHYGDVFTFWDRLFGTGGPVAVEQIEYGLEYFRNDEEQTVKQILLMPFKPLHPDA